jgi:LPXTG-motif cell wall-anchored protein
MHGLSAIRTRKLLLLLAAVATVIASMSVAPPAMAQGTSEITAADCAAGRIVRRGVRLSRAECQRLIGQRVPFARSGADAWIYLVVGAAFLGGAFLLVRRREAVKVRLRA